MKRIAIILGLSGAHLIATLLGIAVVYPLRMDRFDHGGEPGLFETTLDVIVHGLVFPLFYLPSEIRGSNNAIEWFLILTNSFLWGACLYLVGTAARRLYDGH
jgi:hypothetical protein